MDITIVIPVYNRKGLVQKTLDSIPSTFRLIIIDNGSTDGSYEFCRQWKINSRRQNVTVEREFKQGAAAARNKGLDLCKTKWVYFFDSDDEFTGLPSAWDEGSDMICIPTVQVVDGKEIVRAYEPVKTVHTHILNSMLNTISTIYKTEWLRSIGGWNENCRVWDDWELGARALMCKPQLQWITDKAYHRAIVHEESITGASFSDKFEEKMKTMNIVFNEIDKLEEGVEQTRAFFALFFRSYIFSGELQKENNKTASDAVEEFIYSHYRTNKQTHMVGRVVRWYVRKGGRGIWQFAIKAVEMKK